MDTFPGSRPGWSDSARLLIYCTMTPLRSYRIPPIILLTKPRENITMYYKMSHFKIPHVHPKVRVFHSTSLAPQTPQAPVEERGRPGRGTTTERGLWRTGGLDVSGPLVSGVGDGVHRCS